MAEARSSVDSRALSPRKKAIAQEILRRLRKKKYEGYWRRHVWLAAAAAAVSAGLSVIRRPWRRRSDDELHLL